MTKMQLLLEVMVLSLAVVWVCFSNPADLPDVLLPPSMVPEHYDISLDPRVDQGVFFGVVVITGLAIVEADVIVVHCKSLVFNETTVTDLTDDDDINVEDIKENIVLQQCHLHLNRSLRVDHEYQLRLEFMGIIGKEGIGLYNDYYMEGGVRHDILMTNVQPNFARTVFPCFDEPHFKAQFVVRVASVGPPTLISNMPVNTLSSNSAYIPEEDNHRWVEFEESPLMSTYHLVVILCDYLALTDINTNNSIWAPRSRLHEAQLALNVSVQALGHCERYFGMEYALPKLDHIPLTSLNSVAMENWGAITYKKDFLLWEEGVSTWAQKEMVSHVVTHEVIHQWVGNLVTTAWWNTTWLNEGVTTFFHFYMMDKIEPSWNSMDTTFVMQIQQILTEEAVRELRPLTNNEPLHQDAVLGQVFTASTYLKGAAIVRMVYNLMPEDIFRDAILEYISDNAYGAVDEEDLWQSLDAVSDLPESLEAIMYSWTHQPGFPLVTVHRSSDGCLTVTQTKYGAVDQSDVRWTIPLTFTTSSDLDFNVTTILWFPEDQSKMDLGECLEPGDWVIINIRQAGYYRVNYDPDTWRLLTHDLLNCDLADIHPVNRAQILHDSLDLARHGLLEYRVALDITRYLTRETDYLPWAVGVQGLITLRTRLLRTAIFPHFQKYALSLVEDELGRISLTETLGDLLPELHRRQIVEFACTLRHQRCVKEATDMAYLLMSGVHVSIPLDLKSVLLCAAVRHGQHEVWHYVLKEYRKASENDRWKYLVALACSSDRDTIQRLLKDVASPLSFVKSAEERLILFMEIGKQDDTLEQILDMAIRSFNELAESFDFDVILNLLKSFVKPLLTQQERNKIAVIETMVKQTRNEKHMETMESILTDIDSATFKYLYEESTLSWFRQAAPIAVTESQTSAPDYLSEKDKQHSSKDISREVTTEGPSNSADTPHPSTTSVKGDSSLTSRPTRSLVVIVIFIYLTIIRLILS